MLADKNNKKSISVEQAPASVDLSRAPQTPLSVSSSIVTTTTEYGGRDGLDPTRFGDWEKNGRCIDF